MFVDETWFNTQMSRYWGWMEKGERIPEAIPSGHWCNFTLLGAITCSGLLASMTVEASTDTDVFLAFLDQVLCPQLRAGQIVVMDNLSAHKVAAVRAKIKQILRSLKARTAEALDEAITQALACITAENARGWFQHCGYQITQNVKTV